MSSTYDFDAGELQPPPEPYRAIAMALLQTELELGPPGESSSPLWYRILLMGATGHTNTDDFRKLFDELRKRREYVADPNAASSIRLLGLKYTDVNAAPTKVIPTDDDRMPWAPIELESIKNNTVEWSLPSQQHNMEAAAALVHYTPKPWHMKIPPPHSYRHIHDEMQKKKVQMKPQGLWLSDDSAKCHWKSWSEAEQFRLDRLRYKTEVLVDLSDNILLLDGSSVEAVEAFHAKYKFDTDETRSYEKRIAQIKNGIVILETIVEVARKDDIETSELQANVNVVRQCLYDTQQSEPAHFNWIDWSAVMKDYKGFLISPYDKGPFSFLGKHRHLLWFDSVDCASASIWDISCIIDIKPSCKVTDLRVEEPVEEPHIEAKELQVANESSGPPRKRRKVLGDITNTESRGKVKKAPACASSLQDGASYKASAIQESKSPYASGSFIFQEDKDMAEAPKIFRAKETVTFGAVDDEDHGETTGAAVQEQPNAVKQENF